MFQKAALSSACSYMVQKLTTCFASVFSGSPILLTTLQCSHSPSDHSYGPAACDFLYLLINSETLTVTPGGQVLGPAETPPPHSYILRWRKHWNVAMLLSLMPRKLTGDAWMQDFDQYSLLKEWNNKEHKSVINFLVEGILLCLQIKWNS